jgi:hypothetical protein
MAENKQWTALEAFKWLQTNAKTWIVPAQRFSLNGYIHHGFQAGRSCFVQFKMSGTGMTGMLHSKDCTRLVIIIDGALLIKVDVEDRFPRCPAILIASNLTDVYQDSDEDSDSDALEKIRHEVAQRRRQLADTVKITFTHKVFEDFVHVIDGILIEGDWLRTEVCRVQACLKSS